MPTAAPPAPPATKPAAAPANPPPLAPPPLKTPAADFDVSAEIDAMAAADDARAPKPTAKAPAKAEPAKPADKAPEKPATDKPADAKPDDKAPDKAEPVDDGTPLTVPDLRKNYHRVKAENAELRKKLESNGTPKDDPEKSALTSKLTEAEKRHEEAQSELRFANYEKSDEYKKEYVAPIEAAFKSAYEEVTQLAIELEDGSTRQATNADFNALWHMSLPDAIKQAKAWFGDAASEVLAHRRHLIQLNQKRQGAIEKYRTEGAEREKTRLADGVRQREAMTKAWETVNKELVEAHPELYREDDADPDGNKELADGRELAERAFGSKASQLPIGEVVKARAMVWQNTTAFPRLLRRFNGAQERIKELEAELKQFKESEPGAGDGAARAEGADPNNWEAEIDAMAAGRK